ncbi:phosphoglycolate phosphatase [Variovorax sp. J22P240]|uniref:phosphoglycolate phosphatase n=1 Tax=Variovorax sp. J22P240 TaxID=3053514 RepID=UPI0025751D60|nr:phosphoglycolate phosphatase [Variovorax sp. J22P240]MDM0001388.1 phosphoglycolate phosphatase [Variovorax sp. J22P240]
MPLDLSNFDAAIVDLDGTMVDTIGDFVVALNHMLDDLALPHIDAPTVEAMVGKGSEHLIHSVLQQVRATSEDDETWFERAWPRYQHHYLAINGEHAEVYAGVVQGLSALRARGLRLACLTNKPTAFARPLLASKGLTEFFDVMFGGDAFDKKKPDPLPLLKACEALGTRPARTLMLGDSSNDAKAARAAGCPVILVSYGYNHGEPIREVDADGFIDSLADLGQKG